MNCPLCKLSSGHLPDCPTIRWDGKHNNLIDAEHNNLKSVSDSSEGVSDGEVSELEP